MGLLVGVDQLTLRYKSGIHGERADRAFVVVFISFSSNLATLPGPRLTTDRLSKE